MGKCLTKTAKMFLFIFLITLIENRIISGPISSLQCNPDGIGCANFYGMKKNEDKIAQVVKEI